MRPARRTGALAGGGEGKKESDLQGVFRLEAAERLGRVLGLAESGEAGEVRLASGQRACPPEGLPQPVGAAGAANRGEGAGLIGGREGAGGRAEGRAGRSG